MTPVKTQMACFPSPIVTVPFQNNNTTNKNAALIVHIFLDKLQLFFFILFHALNIQFQLLVFLIMFTKVKTEAKIGLSYPW